MDDELWNRLGEWLDDNCERFAGLQLQAPKYAPSKWGVRTVELHGARFIGGITHWSPQLFEFQFLRQDTGDVAILETMTFSAREDLVSYMETLFVARLSYL